jgi:hypothetical protein
MLKIITSLSMLLIGALAQAQVSESRVLAPFSKIKVGDGIELSLTESATPSLTATAFDALSLHDLVTEVNDNTLSVYAKAKLDTPARVIINVKDLKELNLSNAAKANTTNTLQSADFTLVLSSNSIFSGNIQTGKMQLSLRSGAFFNGNITAENFSGVLRGGAQARIAGSAKSSTFFVTTGSVCNATTFASKRSKVVASGNSKAWANAEELMDIDVAEGSVVNVFGTPKKTRLSDNSIISLVKNDAVLTGL